MRIEPFFDPRTWTLTYVVWDPDTRDALVIDPVLDFDPASGRVWRESVQAVLDFLEKHALRLHAILETHAHADHLSGSQAIRDVHPAPIAIGAGVTAVQAVFKGVFDLGEGFAADGRPFDRLLEDGERWALGSLEVEVLATPGHTPACSSYRIRDAVFTGDALFMPDQGVGRCDFPAGSADALYTSVHDRLYRLPDATRVLVGHDYQPGGRPLAWETTIGESKASNVQLAEGTDHDAFVVARRARDATLGAPRLLLPSLQVNIQAGRLPEPHANGRRYLLLPLRVE